MEFNRKNAAIFWAVATTVIIFTWIKFGWQLEEAANNARENRAQNEELAKSLGNAELRLSEIGDEIRSSIEDALRNDVAISPELENKVTQVVSDTNQLKQAVEQLRQEKAVQVVRDVQRKANFEEMQSLKQSLEGLVKQVRDRVNERNRLVSALRENESGRRIATSDRHVDRFEAITMVLSPSGEDVDRWIVKHANLFELVDTPDRPPESFTITETADADILELKQNLTAATKILSEDILLLNTLVEETAEETPAEESLASCIAARISKRAIERADAIAAAAEKARKDGTIAQSEAAAEAQNAQDRLDAAIKAAETAELDAAANEKTSERNQILQEARQKRERKQLELDYSHDEKEIRSLLHPFITQGIYHPSRYGVDSRYPPEPMSLSAIGTVGALDQTDAGLSELYRIGGNDFTAMRGLGTFPSQKSKTLHTSSPDRKRVERAQELLLKYGALLVEKGVLLN